MGERLAKQIKPTLARTRAWLALALGGCGPGASSEAGGRGVSAGTRFRNSLSLPSDRRPGELDTGRDEYLTLEWLRGYAKLSVRTLRNYLNLPPAAALPCYGSPAGRRRPPRA